ncbi:HisA/HisF-related TIM barrel protein [Noviherbaspirillum aridicola]|uniref:Uncharacterized protein n=1 Tax=Noviherbaspirillum aridicola TaxID=2849687 RepID=A0ABQ4Q297_9BURK|nr:HisA/HisF-related TIM barrel protein [Noviherbaspirillum aridicola]GIZ51301.1 hypothetical protein NCCP691_13150 [Noviherbaspirillum aridicola]
MIKKRLIGVVTVRDGLAVQSFGYRRYLPLGRPEILVENLDRWGADEILVQCTDRSTRGLGPDLALLERIGRLGLSTPLIYAGGIRNAEDARAATKAAADRVCVDALLQDDPGALDTLAAHLGAQAIIAALPLSREDGELRLLDYRQRRSTALPAPLLGVLGAGMLSEVLIIDWRNEGRRGGFDQSLLTGFPANIPLIAFGGLSEAQQLQQVFELPQVVAAAVGNFLAYEEHAIQHLKKQLTGIALRPAVYRSSLTP